jgi:hypothetical protein
MSKRVKMQSLGLVGLWLLLNVALCSDVQIMTIDSFDNFRASLKHYPHALVRFSTEWNYRSIITEKPFQDAATYLKTTKPQVTLIEVFLFCILLCCADNLKRSLLFFFHLNLTSNEILFFRTRFSCLKQTHTRS